MDNLGDDIRRQIMMQYAAGKEAAIQRLYWKMIAAGQLPSQGWTIGVTERQDGMALTFTCFAVPPPDQSMRSKSR